MSDFTKTTFRARWYLEARASEYQAFAAGAHEALYGQQGILPRMGTKTRMLKDMVRVQHAAAYHAAIARECLLAALRLREGQDQ